jgi:hypothetical protein
VIRSNTDPRAYVLSDYQELNFHAKRRSTYQGAEISAALVEQGQITAKQLIAEMETYDVKMVILDVSPETGHQLITLPDYTSFVSYLERNFDLLGRFSRSEQLLEVHLRGMPDSQD